MRAVVGLPVHARRLAHVAPARPDAAPELRTMSSSITTARTRSDGGGHRGDLRIGEDQPQPAGGHDVLDGADDDVAERLGTGVHDGARAGFRAVREQRRAAAEQQDHHLRCRIGRIDDGERQERAGHRPHQRVDAVPEDCRARRSCRPAARRHSRCAATPITHGLASASSAARCCGRSMMPSRIAMPVASTQA